MSDTTYICGKTLYGQTFMCPINSNEFTVNDLKKYISECLQTRKDNLRIVLCGFELKDNVYLRDTTICSERCFHILTKQKTTYIHGKSITGCPVTFPIISKDDTVNDIKEYIKEYYPEIIKANKKDNLTIILCGVKLENNVYLRDTTICKEAFFHVI